MSKKFDKSSFKKANDRLAIVFVVLFLLGAVSIICAFTIGNGLSAEDRSEATMSNYDTYSSMEIV